MLKRALKHNVWADWVEMPLRRDLYRAEQPYSTVHHVSARKWKAPHERAALVEATGAVKMDGRWH